MKLTKRKYLNGPRLPVQRPETEQGIRTLYLSSLSSGDQVLETKILGDSPAVKRSVVGGELTTI
jgi:hypothetical protein